MRIIVGTGMVWTIAAPGILDVAEITDAAVVRAEITGAAVITDAAGITGAVATVVQASPPAQAAIIVSLTGCGPITHLMSALPLAATTRTELRGMTRWVDQTPTRTTGPSRDERGAVRDRVKLN